jgi:hypothetical protein
MSVDRASRNGVLGGPPRAAERCPRTGRIYEDGSGALSKEEQTALFEREAAIAADMPKLGERCPQTGRPYERSIGALSKMRQTANFLAELSPAAKVQRKADADALAAVEPAGSA